MIIILCYIVNDKTGEVLRIILLYKLLRGKI